MRKNPYWIQQKYAGQFITLLRNKHLLDSRRKTKKLLKAELRDRIKQFTKEYAYVPQNPQEKAKKDQYCFYLSKEILRLRELLKERGWKYENKEL